MTSNAGSRSDSALPNFEEDDIDALKKRKIRREQILNGALPSVGELLSGMPFCEDDLQSDVMHAVDVWKAKYFGKAVTETIAAAEVARADASVVTLTQLYDELDPKRHVDWKLYERVSIWLAYCGDKEIIAKVCASAITADYGSEECVPSTYRMAFAVGITTRADVRTYDRGDADRIMMYGMRRLSSIATYLQPLELTTILDKEGAVTGIDGLLKRWSACTDEEPETPADKLDALLADGDHGLVVVPRLPYSTSKSNSRDIRKEWDGTAGRALPMARRGDIGAWRRQLVERWPHASDVIDVVLGDLAATDTVRFRPTLLVGEPGSGKSSLARAIMETVGLPTQLVAMAGASDSSLMGTSAQWSTARECIPVQLIKAAKKASVGMIWDEIEKADPGRNNGSATDALLPMLEIDQAKRFRDLALEVECDLSMVSHFATANALAGIPDPIRDRFRVLTMPDPGWQHLHVLTRQIVDRIAAERGVDARWFAPLAEDEIDLVKGAWPGGSIRKLTSIVRTIIAGRDRLIGRC